MSKALWLTGVRATGSAPHQASMPSHRAPVGDWGPGGDTLLPAMGLSLPAAVLV